MRRRTAAFMAVIIIIWIIHSLRRKVERIWRMNAMVRLTPAIITGMCMSIRSPILSRRTATIWAIRLWTSQTPINRNFLIWSCEICTSKLIERRIRDEFAALNVRRFVSLTTSHSKSGPARCWPYWQRTVSWSTLFNEKTFRVFEIFYN